MADIQSFKSLVRSILMSMGNGATEREFRALFYETEGYSFNVILEKCNTNFYNFFLHLSDVCRVTFLGNVLVLQRVSSQATAHMDNLTINKYSKNYKGLKLPKVHAVPVRNTFFRNLNPNPIPFNPWNNLSHSKNQNARPLIQNPNIHLRTYQYPRSSVQGFNTKNVSSLRSPVNNFAKPITSAINPSIPKSIQKVSNTTNNLLGESWEQIDLNKSLKITVTYDSNENARKVSTVQEKSSDLLSKEKNQPDNLDARARSSNLFQKALHSLKSKTFDSEQVTTPIKPNTSDNLREDAMKNISSIQEKSPLSSNKENLESKKSEARVKSSLLFKAALESLKSETVDLKKCEPVNPFFRETNLNEDEKHFEPKTATTSKNIEISISKDNELVKPKATIKPIRNTNDDKEDQEILFSKPAELQRSRKRVMNYPSAKQISENAFFKIKIIDVISPSNFIFQYSFDSLNILVDTLNSHYKNLEDIEAYRVQTFIENLAVVVRRDNAFYRAQIVTFDDSYACVDFVDYKTAKPFRTLRSHIFHLHPKFEADPPKSFRGMLFGLRPRGSEWCPESILDFFDFQDKIYMATIKGVQNGIYALSIIVDPNNFKRLSDVYIEEKYASLNIDDYRNSSNNLTSLE